MNLDANEATSLSIHSDWLSVIHAHARAHMQMTWEAGTCISIILILDAKDTISLHILF